MIFSTLHETSTIALQLVVMTRENKKRTTKKCLCMVYMHNYLFDKIQSLGVPQSMCLWILDFILNRPHQLRYLLARLRAVFCHHCYIIFLHVIGYLVT